jgi:hypothetical protein
MIMTRRFNAHATGDDHLRLLETIQKCLHSKPALYWLLITTANHSYRTFGNFRLCVSIFFSSLYLYYLASYFDSSKSLSVLLPTESRFSGSLHRHTSIIMLYYITLGGKGLLVFYILPALLNFLSYYLGGKSSSCLPCTTSFIEVHKIDA